MPSLGSQSDTKSLLLYGSIDWKWRRSASRDRSLARREVNGIHSVDIPSSGKLVLEISNGSNHSNGSRLNSLFKKKIVDSSRPAFAVHNADGISSLESDDDCA